MPPRTSRSNGPSSILTETAAGHCLLDAFASIDNNFPDNWHTLHHAPSLTSSYDSGITASHKKRKREPAPQSENEMLAELHHLSVVQWLEDAVQSVREEWLATMPVAWTRDAIALASDTASAASETALDLAALESALREVRDQDDRADEEPVSEHQTVRLDSGAESSIALSELCHRNYVNKGPSTAVLRTPAGSFLIPPRSGFNISDLTTWRTRLSAMDMSYDVVIMDPPWRSKSVRRSSSYQEMDLYDLYKIDLPNILLTSAAKRPVLIGVWVTNHPKYRAFVKEKLLPDWNVRETSDWYWVKITSSGSAVDGKQNDSASSVAQGGLPVWSLHGPSPRRCYEGLILGWHNPFHLALDVRMQRLPKSKAFLSVPLGHSRKPQILDLLAPYLQTAHPSILELFARYTQRGRGERGHWMSVGNESVKFNQIGVHIVSRDEGRGKA